MRSKSLMRVAIVAVALVLLAVTGSASAATGGSAEVSADQAGPAGFGSAGYIQIRNVIHSQCVGTPTLRIRTQTYLGKCPPVGVSRQSWALVPTGAAANTYFLVQALSGFCLEVNNGTNIPGEPVILNACSGQPAQQWVRVGLRLRHAGTDQCLDTVAGPGSNLMQYTCGQEAPAGIQSWVIESSDFATPGGRANASADQAEPAFAGTGFVQLRNAVYSQCAMDSVQPKAQLALVQCTGGWDWVMVPTGAAANTYFIVSGAFGYCMEVNNGTSTPTEPVIHNTCSGQPAQQWVRAGLALRHAGTNQCLDTVAGRGSQLMQYTCGQEAPVGVQSWAVEA